MRERERIKRLTLPGKSGAGQQEETGKLTEQHGCFTLPSDLVGLNTNEVGSLQETVIFSENPGLPSEGD